MDKKIHNPSSASPKEIMSKKSFRHGGEGIALVIPCGVFGGGVSNRKVYEPLRKTKRTGMNLGKTLIIGTRSYTGTS